MMQSSVYMLHVTRSFTISMDLPHEFSADHLRNLHRFSEGFPRKRQRLSAESSKGIRGIIKGNLQICLRASAQSELSKASAELRE